MDHAIAKLVVREKIVVTKKLVESSQTILSNNLLTKLKRLIGRKFQKFERSLLGFGMGMTFACFHLIGKNDSFRQPLNN
jgi:hypothetical protein